MTRAKSKKAYPVDTLSSMPGVRGYFLGVDVRVRPGIAVR